ncbi:MAG: DNA primase [bacterium]|nr:DNA primase [bacterium]
MIPQETIEQIREATDIVQIVGEYLRLKKRGRDMWAPCPFHSEKTPSFKVSPEKQFYHCFGCGKGGNVITFLMEHEKMSFVEAVRHLAVKAGITIREAGGDHRRETFERLNYAHTVAVEYFHKVLFEKRFAVVLDKYLGQKRQIEPECIETFKLGLCGEDWDGLLKYAAKKDISGDEMFQAGLACKSEKTGNYFDRFRQRLMIPIYSLSNKPIAFGGRTMKKGEPAKYINSPETPLYSKSNVLYGLNFARDHIREAASVYVVEGYFDVISLWQNGVKNVVASSGTAFTPQQARLLARFAEEVYLFFDADSAGRQAALRSVDSLYDAGLDVKVLQAPQGEDPDSVAREHGAERIEELKQAALAYIPFRIQDTNPESAGIVAREKLVKELAALASRIADPTRRMLFVQEASERLNVRQTVFQSAMQPQATPEPGLGNGRSRFDQREFELLSLMLSSPAAVDRAFESITPEDFDSKQLSRIFAAMAAHYERTSALNAHRLIEDLRDHDISSILTELASFEWDTEEIDAEARRAIRRFHERKLGRIRTRLKAELADATARADQNRVNEIVQEMKDHGLYDA